MQTESTATESTATESTATATESTATVTETTPEAALIESLMVQYDCPPVRRDTLTEAQAKGAALKVLHAIANAPRVSKSDTIVLPSLRYENLSRGRGWARKGKGSDAVWGERTDKGYRVGPGRWTVGATDGFSRKDSCTWTVKHVQVGSEVWTVAE
jgi:hypothetical protein